MTYDLVFLGILIIAAWRGAVKGIVWQLAAIAALVLSFAFAEWASVAVAPLILLDPPLNRWAAMFVLYLACSFLSFAIARTIHGWMEKAKFVEYDRHLGGLLGLVKGGTLCLVISFFVVTLLPAQQDALMHSFSGRAAAIVMDRLHPVMPAELHDVLEPYIHRLDSDDLELQNRHGRHHADAEEDTSVKSNHHADEQGADSSETTDVNDGDRFEKLVARLPGIFGDEMRDLALRALRNTAVEDRDELLEKLRTGIPGMIRQISVEWKDGKPQAEDADEIRAHRERLLREISAVYSDFPEAQQSVFDEIEAALSGIPDAVAAAVLEDWHADLFDKEEDPDAETTATASLDHRILRQLEIARVPVSNLSQRLQDRLRGPVLR